MRKDADGVTQILPFQLLAYLEDRKEAVFPQLSGSAQRGGSGTDVNVDAGRPAALNRLLSITLIQP